MIYFCFMILACLMGSTTAFAQSLQSNDARYQQLLERVEQLESQQAELLLSNEGERNHVYSFLKDNLTVGGFFESGFSAVSGPDTRFQAINDSNILGLNIAADFNSRWRFVSQILTGLAYPLNNIHNDPRNTPVRREFGNPVFGALLAQGYLEYSFSDHLRIQGGEGYVPFGYALQQRELVLFIRRGGPQLLRTPTIVNPLWSGLHVSGLFTEGKNEWGYNAYTTNPTENPKVSGLGARVWWSSEDDVFLAGISSQVKKSKNDTDEVYGTDLRYNSRPVLITAEFAQRNHRDGDAWTAYAEPGIYIHDDEILLFVFGDYLHSTLNETGGGATAVDDPFSKWEYGAGVNWLPTPFTRIRLSYSQGDYVGNRSSFQGQNRDFRTIDLSAGIAF